METTFKPFKAEDKKTEFIDVLMSGDGIKTDKAHDFVEIIPRGNIKFASGGVGIASSYRRMMRADDVLKDVLREMKKEGYIVLTRESSEIYKGNAKATTYYLAGE